MIQLHTLPKVSVLIPAFNEEKYILLTLEALIRQDYPRFEIIVADNASTDATAMIVENFISPASRCGLSIRMVHEINRGTNFAREAARKIATGSVIAQLDADCIPPPDWLSTGVKLLCHPSRKRVAVTGPYDYFDGDSRMRTVSMLGQKLIYPLLNRLVQLSGRAAILIGGNAFIRADMLAKAGGYNTELTFYGDDVDLGKELSVFGRVDYMPALVQRSSSRRYKANGFWEVNKKYQHFFWNLVWGNKGLPGIENSHPR